jgi:hypothetical protein
MSNVYIAGYYNAICSRSTRDKSSRNSRTKISGVIRMGETPVRDDGTVTRSAEVSHIFPSHMEVLFV